MLPCLEWSAASFASFCLQNAPLLPMHDMLFCSGSVFFILLFAFCLPSAHLLTVLFLTSIAPVSPCRLSHAGMWNKLLNCSTVPSRQHPIPPKRLLIFAFLIYTLSREDKEGHSAPHSANKWCVEVIREGCWGKAASLRVWLICLLRSRACELTFIDPESTGGGECFSTSIQPKAISY